MSTHTRHFVSQRFGKSTVTVDFQDQAGVVRIVAPRPGASTIAFAFPMEQVERTFSDPATRPEMIMRIAIQQSHKLFILNGEGGLFGATLALAIGTTPWLGDLSDAAYGGATAGYAVAADTLAPPPLPQAAA